MLARLGNNFTTGVIPFYLVYTIEMSEESTSSTPWQLAVVPLTMYLASVFCSFSQTKLSRYSRSTLYISGSILLLFTGVSMYFLDFNTRYLIFPVVLMLGVGTSLCLNASMGMISAFVGSDAHSGAFVWGAMGFLDKFSVGAIFFAASSIGDLRVAEYVRILTSSELALCGVVGAFCALNVQKVQEYSNKEELPVKEAK